MPEISKKFIPAHKGDKNPDPKLLKFARKVTDRVHGKLKGVTTDDPEYWGLACIFEDEMDAKTKEAALNLLLDVVSSKALKVREHRPYPLLVEWNRKKHYTETDEEFDLLLAISRSIIYNHAYERERCLLHREAIHRISDILSLIEGETPATHFKFWIFHNFYFFILFKMGLVMFKTSLYSSILLTLHIRINTIKPTAI